MKALRGKPPGKTHGDGWGILIMVLLLLLLYTLTGYAEDQCPEDKEVIGSRVVSAMPGEKGRFAFKEIIIYRCVDLYTKN